MEKQSSLLKNKIGKVITFYSYKGGVGRSMAMANVGVLFAKWGYRTLLVDWDLEAPGLENYFKGYLDINKTLQKKGLIELLNLRADNGNIDIDSPEWEKFFGDVNLYDFITSIQINGQDELHLLTAGKRDSNYIENVRKFDYSSFYKDNDGARFMEDVRERWQKEYDFILIDSRTGFTDSSRICSVHMPDILVLLFTPNEQSFDGIKDVAKKAMEDQQLLIYDRFLLRTLPIPSRVETNETQLMDIWMNKIAGESTEMLKWVQRHEDNNNKFLISPIDLIKKIKVPYRTLYAFGETLPVLERGTLDSNDVGYSYETIAALLANDLQHAHLLTDSRDDLVKKAKGEEVIDHSELQRKVAIKDEQLRDITEKSKTIEKRSKRTQLIVAWASFIVLLFVILFFVIRPRTFTEVITKDPVDTTDSLAKKAYLEFQANYTRSDQQFDLNFNLGMIRQYYKLSPQYRDSLLFTKSNIEGAVFYKLKNVTDSFYIAIRSGQVVTPYLANVVDSFGFWKNTNGQTLGNTLTSFSKYNSITNKPIDSTFMISSDSSGFKLNFIETGNILLGRLKEYKSIRNSNTIAFDDSFRIKSISCQILDSVPRKLTVEFFLCPSNNTRVISARNNLINSLKQENLYTILVRNNFNSSPDPTSPFHISSSQIRYNGDDERKVAESLQKEITESTQQPLKLSKIRGTTNNYISVFLICDEAKK